MIKLDGKFANYIVENCQSRTAVMQRFGISYNTLRKIESGQPIRPSVALRLMDRLRSELG